LSSSPLITPSSSLPTLNFLPFPLPLPIFSKSNKITSCKLLSLPKIQNRVSFSSKSYSSKLTKHFNCPCSPNFRFRFFIFQ
ncbi:hypothetical protein VIGAN_06210800, partial [Vigna angularis var. angularis]